MKQSNKATLSLRLLSKCSFTPSKLRFFELRKPKISTCYTTSRKMGLTTLFLDSPIFFAVMMPSFEEVSTTL